MKLGGRKRRNLSSTLLKNVSIHSFDEDTPLINAYEKKNRPKDNFKSNHVHGGWISSAKFLCAIAVLMMIIASVIGLYAFQHYKHVHTHENFPQGDQDIDVIEELTDAIDDDM